MWTFFRGPGEMETSHFLPYRAQGADFIVYLHLSFLISVIDLAFIIVKPVSGLKDNTRKSRSVPEKVTINCGFEQLMVRIAYQLSAGVNTQIDP